MLLSGSVSAETFVIRNARVFDGQHVIAHADVWVEGNKIESLGEHLDVPVDVKVVDGTNATLLPGLIDSHTHSWGDALRQAVVFGVTTELDMFTDIRFAKEAKLREAKGESSDRADLRS